ncbi:hypothetical protein F511_35226 [Dorcoceras hygrometricum]|uniref:Uncharacterized protein n=1 Tax=Dorcoceras hygrometricum TaxID=472368 RepID=A0A2Z7B6U7_9LAMI|nr:hypothetical protein F511_35226 [Dorcoceras hygrometricum]
MVQAPGSDQFHGEIGTSTVEQLRPPNLVHDRNLNSFVGLHQKTNESFTDGIFLPRRSEQIPMATTGGGEGGEDTASRELTTFVTPKPYFGLTHRIMVKRLATSPHDPIGITDSACKNQSVMIAVDNRQSGPRPEPRLLRQAALEALTNSARTDSPRRIGRNEFRRLEATAAAAAACLREGGGGFGA